MILEKQILDYKTLFSRMRKKKYLNKFTLNWTCLAFFPSIWVMLAGMGWEHGCFYSWAIFLLLGAAIGSSAHFASAFHSASLRLVSRAAPPSQLNQPRAEQLSWGGRASLCLFSLHSVGTTAISACCFWGVGADWMDYSLFHGSSSLYWCAGMAAYERCSQLGKLCEIFAGCSRYFLLGWVLNERACLFNWVWFRWPIPSSLIWESLGTNFQLDLISIVFFYILLYCTTLPCFVNSILDVLPC